MTGKWSIAVSGELCKRPLLALSTLSRSQLSLTPKELQSNSLAVIGLRTRLGC